MASDGSGANSFCVALCTTVPGEAERIARLDSYIELASVPNFQRKFAEATYL